MIDYDAVPYNTEILYFSESPLNVHHVCNHVFVLFSVLVTHNQQQVVLIVCHIHHSR
jgi:hypothetical protein